MAKIKKTAIKKESDSEKAPQAAGSGEWVGKSQAMFERMLQEVPEAMRGVFRDKLMHVLNQKAKGAAFAEGHVMEIVHELVPEPFKSNILKAFSTMGDLDMNMIEQIIDQYPGGQETLITILHDIQTQCGYIPQQALNLVSQKKGVFLSVLYRLVTSYKAFRITPLKKNLVAVCNGSGCHIKGSGKLVQALEKKSLENGSQISLEKIRCLGCCDISPAVMINGELFGGAAAETKIAELVRE